MEFDLNYGQHLTKYPQQFIKCLCRSTVNKINCSLKKKSGIFLFIESTALTPNKSFKIKPLIKFFFA